MVLIVYPFLKRNMKILLIRPPEIYYGKHYLPTFGIPLGIAYICAYLKRAGYNDVKIYDFLVCRESIIRLSSSGKLIYGTPFHRIRETIKNESPDIVGISNIASTQLESTILTAQAVKEVNKNIFVVAGGAHPSVQPWDFLKEKSLFDAVIIGEGEKTFVTLVTVLGKNRRLSEIGGIAYLENDNLKINKDINFILNLDEIPIPAYEDLDMEEYFKKRYLFLSARPSFYYDGSERSINMITSRGCPYNCIFCSIHLTMGYRWRCHSAEYVLKHIRTLIDRYDINHIHFEDDNLTHNRDRFKRIIDGLGGLSKKVTWDTPNGVRADLLDEEIIKKSKKAGCVYMTIGVESGDEYVLNKIIKKRLSLNDVIKTAKKFQQSGLNLEAFYIIGFPGEHKHNILKTILFALRLQILYDVYPILFMATPLPGTELYDICIKNKYIKQDFPYQLISASILKKGIFQTEEFDLSFLRFIFRGFLILRTVNILIHFIYFIFRHPFYAKQQIINGIKLFSHHIPKRIIIRNLLRYKLFTSSNNRSFP